MIKKTIILITAMLFSFIVNDYSVKDPAHVSFLSEQDKKEIDCLALNLYKEARGEPLEGILAVASVTINRTKSALFPSSICEVVYQKTFRVCQFSWVCDKMSLRKINERMYENIRSIATYVYVNRENIEDKSNGALFYHADYVKPEWRKKMVMTTQIGRHIFYKI